MYRTDFWTLWEKVRVVCFKRTAWKHVYYLGWNRSPAQVGCMRQVLGPGAMGRPRGIGWRGRWEGGSGWGIHVYPWLIHVNVWQKPLQYCKVISLQLIKIKIKKKKKKIIESSSLALLSGHQSSIPGEKVPTCGLMEEWWILSSNRHRRYSHRNVVPNCCMILSWPKRSLGFFHTSIQKNQNKLFGQPSAMQFNFLCIS